MYRSALELQGYKLEATDGEFGSVSDFLFDDRSWVVRYLVADTRRWLPGKKVLIAPEALSQPDWAAQRFPVSLTRKQIEACPGLEADQPVSRQYETALRSYYQWNMYWTAGDGAWGWPAAVARAQQAKQPGNVDSHLRSLDEITGYHIEATDGSVGHVEDLVVNDEEWWLPYVVVDTKNWLPGRKVLVSPTWVRDFDWAGRRLVVDLARDVIEKSPKFDPTTPVNREYEQRLYDYYGRPAYWTELASRKGR